ncbi:MAG: hypothetical protein HFJ45_05095 [Clostridia bacterium]|nr:hypothetical protein [Clostridia bacterium]
MENDQIVIPFDVQALHTNLIERVFQKIKFFIKVIIKRILEIIFSILGIVFLIPLTIAVALRKFINKDKSKIFRVQNKIGKNGKIFKMYTFNYESDKKFLKKSGLYILPQIVNILKGDMTFVGPKAYSEKQKEDMGEYYSYIIQHKPGITGIPQISKYAKDNFLDRLDMDLRYHYRRNFSLDLKIILITLLITLRAKKTYNIGSQINKSIKDIKILIESLIKRILDIVAGIVGIIILIPITIIIKLVYIFTKEKGSVFYVQDRIGKDGKVFKLYKYRSMVENADEKLKELLQNDEKAREEYRLNKKLKNDPRLTKIGAFLRKTSIDELPQLINVFKGNMSLVGPRPYLPREKEDMGEHYRYIINSKPGLTGLWQISGRSNTTFERRMQFDRQYNINKSLKTDVKILCKTVGVVFKGVGAA